MMKKFLLILLTLIVSALSLGFASCGEAEVEPEVEPYIIAKLSPSCSRNQHSALYYATGVLGQVVTFVCETPKLEGWYITYSADNVDKTPVDEENGKYEAYNTGICYITVTYTNGIDKVTDMICCYYDHRNLEIDVFFSSNSGLYTTEKMSKNWELSLGTPIELSPILFFNNKRFDDAIISSITIEDQSILSYENGVLTPLSAGTTKILIDCTWRGYNSTSWGNKGKEGTGSADLKREITVTVS